MPLQWNRVESIKPITWDLHITLHIRENTGVDIRTSSPFLLLSLSPNILQSSPRYVDERYDNNYNSPSEVESRDSTQPTTVNPNAPCKNQLRLFSYPAIARQSYGSNLITNTEETLNETTAGGRSRSCRSEALFYGRTHSARFSAQLKLYKGRNPAVTCPIELYIRRYIPYTFMLYSPLIEPSDPTPSQRRRNQPI